MPKKKEEVKKLIVPLGGVDLPEDVAKNLTAKAEYTVSASSSHGYVAYAPFSFLGVSYQEGDEFAPPAGYERDTAFEEFRNLERRHGEQIGLAFSHPPVIEPGRKEPTYRRTVLPVKEA